MATYHIAKTQTIQGTEKTVYFQGNNSWTTEFADRKKWTNKTKAKAELYSFGGAVVTE